MTSHAKTFLTVCRFETVAVHQPFERDGMPFERLELSVQKQLGAVRTAGAIRSKKIGSRSNGWSYPFQKNWEPFERLELSVQKKLGAVRTAGAIRFKKVVSRSNWMFVANGWRYVLICFVCVKRQRVSNRANFFTL